MIKKRIKLKCKICKKEFKVKPSYKRAKYCSKKCSHKAHSKLMKTEKNPNWKPRIKKVCLVCKKEFEVNPFKKDTTKYCSYKCCHKSKQTNFVVKCKLCNKKFKTIPSENAEYCSRKCYFKSRPEKPIIKCKVCNNKFVVEPHRKNTAKYCSKKCLKNNKITITCLICNKKFKICPSVEHRIKTCSPKCKSEKQRKRAILKCAYCGKEEIMTPSRVRYRKYCSYICANKLNTKKGKDHHRWKPRIKKVCLTCDKEFGVVPHDINKKYCSKKCMSKNKKYSDLCSIKKIGVLNPMWEGGHNNPYPTTWNKRLRRSIRERDDNMCQLCGKHRSQLKKALDVHHIDSVKTNGFFFNLISLCSACHTHTKYGKRKAYWIAFFQALLKEKYGYDYPLSDFKQENLKRYEDED